MRQPEAAGLSLQGSVPEIPVGQGAGVYSHGNTESISSGGVAVVCRALRAVRRSHADPERVVIAAADPLNLVGILTPGSRVSPYSNRAILYRDGYPVDIGPLGVVLSRWRHTQKA